MNKSQGVVLQPQTPFSSLMRSTKQILKKAQEQTVSLLAPNLRDQQLREVSLEKTSTTDEKWSQVFLVLSGNLAIAGTSLLYPPLTLFLIPGLIYSFLPMYQLAYKGFREGCFSSYIIDVLLVTGMFVGGMYRSAALYAWIFSLSRTLLSKSEDNSKRKLMNLFGQQQRSVWTLVGGFEIEIPFEELQAGDVIILIAGQSSPADGVITDGYASVDQHMLTGESKPAEKGVGDLVLASTVILAGRICVETQKTGQETVAMQIGEIMNQTADFKSLMQSRGEAIADQLVIPILGMSVLTSSLLGFNSGIAILTNSFGYKMRLFAPASMLAFLSTASQQGILIKDGRSLDLLKEINSVFFE